MGVGAVALVHASVRRWYGHAAGLMAGALVVAAPVAAMMFRFDNPDAMLTILMAAAAYFVTRAIETDRGRNACGGWWPPVQPSASPSSPRCCRACSCCPASCWPT